MLVLTRKVGQSLMIGDDVEIVFFGINGNQIKVGINAPADIKVHRFEIYEKIQEQKKKEITVEK